MVQQTQRIQPSKEHPQHTEGAVEYTPNPAHVELPAQPELSTPVETTKEQPGMQVEESGGISDAIEGLTQKLRKPKQTKKTLADVASIRDELTKEVEHVMEDGLKDAFTELSPAEAQAFKIKGEETAREIRQLLKSSKVKVKKIFQLLFAWLKLLPGVNVFFLEQEAKIKADKIMALHRKQMSHREMNITIK